MSSQTPAQNRVFDASLSVFMLVKTNLEWLGLPVEERFGLLAKHVEPILHKHQEKVRLRSYDVEFYSARVTDIWLWDAADAHSYELLVEDLRETPFWDRYFAIVEILAGVENAYAKNYGRQALPAHKERRSNLRAEVGPLAGVFTFGPFRLLPEERVLLEDGKAVQLGGRALDILTALVVRSGTLISKEELISYAWPRARVEEANLRVHIGALRHALGENRAGARYVATVAGRGYCFVAPVRREETSAVAALPPRSSSTTMRPRPDGYGYEIAVSLEKEFLQIFKFVTH
jgi:DNA-binding winged helix-turn-helix (wHTH) protein